jgi:outer membrane protein TolC
MTRLACVIAVSILLCGCGMSGFEEHHRVSPEDIQALVDKAPYPDLTPPASAAPPSKIVTKPDGTRVVNVNLLEALRLALRNNQGFLSSGEGLTIQLLGLEVLRRSWWPLQDPLTGNVSWSDSPEGSRSASESISAGISQKLPFGGSASLSYGYSGSQPVGPNFYSGVASAAVSMPILRGGGWRIAIEERVAAERSYAYAQRNYAFGRTSLLVDTVQTYFGLLQQEVNIANQERNLVTARRTVRMAELRFAMGAVTRTDVFRAELNVTNAENQLSNTRDQLRLARDAFKFDLGLKQEDELILERERLDFKPQFVREKKLVQVFPGLGFPGISIRDEVEFLPMDEEIRKGNEGALATNPQWLNARDQFDDAGRALEIARNATMTRVDIGASYSWAQEAETRPFDEFETGSRSFSVTGSFSIDLDFLSLNRSYQAAVIAYRQAERAYLRARDNIARETQSRYTQVRVAETNTINQRRAIEQARKLVRLLEFRYEQGQVGNFDVIDAQAQELNARNAYEQALVAAKISQLRLLQWIGRLEPDEEGRWVR